MLGRSLRAAMNISLDLILAIVAAVLGAIDVFTGRGRSFSGWGVIALAAIFLIGGFGVGR